MSCKNIIIEVIIIKRYIIYDCDKNQLKTVINRYEILWYSKFNYALFSVLIKMKSQMEIKVSHFKIYLNQRLGSGSFGQIYKGGSLIK